MADYIKREDALESCETISEIVYRRIKRLPAADVRENVRGEWDWKISGKAESGGTLGKARCSECKAIAWATATDGELNFCPNCGADMRGEKDGLARDD